MSNKSHSKRFWFVVSVVYCFIHQLISSQFTDQYKVFFFEFGLSIIDLLILNVKGIFIVLVVWLVILTQVRFFGPTTKPESLIS